MLNTTFVQQPLFFSDKTLIQTMVCLLSRRNSMFNNSRRPLLEINFNFEKADSPDPQKPVSHRRSGVFHLSSTWDNLHTFSPRHTISAYRIYFVSGQMGIRAFTFEKKLHIQISNREFVWNSSLTLWLMQIFTREFPKRTQHRREYLKIK